MKRVLLGASVGAALALLGLRWWSRTARNIVPAQVVDIRSGQSLRQIAEMLARSGVVESPHLLGLYVRLQRVAPKLQAARYRFHGPTTPQQVVAKLVNGDAYHEKSFEITLPEGLNLTELRQKLLDLGIEADPGLRSCPAVLTQVRSRAGAEISSLEGYLYPATYPFYDSRPNLCDVLATMVRMFFAKLPPDVLAAAQQRRLSLHEAVTFASLIEKETALDHERSQVAEVIWNRLRRQMPLGIDAAIIYGIEKFDGKLRRSDLRERANPYNTRVHRGLPPGPISNVSAASLAAVVAPSAFGYLYYVRQPDRSGAHVFSRTLKEHNLAVARWVRYDRER